jgi:hypothetical protein
MEVYMTDFLLYKCGIQSVELACQLYASGYFFNFVLFEFLLEAIIYIFLVCMPFLLARVDYKYIHFQEFDKQNIINKYVSFNFTAMLLGTIVVIYCVTIPAIILTVELLTSPAKVDSVLDMVSQW